MPQEDRAEDDEVPRAAQEPERTFPRQGNGPASVTARQRW